jgi:serine/threonine protein kinase
LKGSSPNEKTDIWSCGVVLYLFLSGQHPFFHSDDEKVITSLTCFIYMTDACEYSERRGGI